MANTTSEDLTTEDFNLLMAISRAEKAEAEIRALKAAQSLEESRLDQRIQSRISILKLIFLGISSLMCFLGILVLVNWYIPGSADVDGIGAAFFQTSKDILLVLTGILGSAMASVFDSRSGSRASDTKEDTGLSN